MRKRQRIERSPLVVPGHSARLAALSRPVEPVAHRTRTADATLPAPTNGALRKLRDRKSGRASLDHPEPAHLASDEPLEDPREEEEEEGEEDELEEDSSALDQDDLDLTQATTKSLLRCRRDDLTQLCSTRQLPHLNRTKKQLVTSLLEWRSSSSSRDDSASPDSTTDSTASDNSNATARADQSFDYGSDAETEDGQGQGLLMRKGHAASPNKPMTPMCSKENEQEEVNGLDLESLQLADKEIMPEKLTKLEKIGSGGFKDVYKGIYRKKTIAIADIRGHLTEMDIKELGLLRDLRHPNIVHFIGVSIPKEPSSIPVMICTELCANGDLFDYIRAVEHPPFLTMLEIMLGIAKGLEYLHTRTPAIIHRDLKSSNILVTAQGVAKINDFGLARVKISTKSVIRSLVGTVNWQAPELWVPHPRYNEKVDVYSIGLVYWEVLQWHQPMKRYPFEGLNEHAIYVDVGQKKLRPSTASMGRQWGLEIVELVDAMWTTDPSMRPSMAHVVLELECLITAQKEKLALEKKSRR